VPRRPRVIAACPPNLLAVVVGVAVVVLPGTDTLEPVGEQSRAVFERATDEQVNVVGVDGEVLDVESLVFGYLVDDGFHTVCDLAGQYRLTVLWYPHYVVVEVVGRVPCGLHPCCILCILVGEYLEVDGGKSGLQ
jgi:hypothetical protein